MSENMGWSAESREESKHLLPHWLHSEIVPLAIVAIVGFGWARRPLTTWKNHPLTHTHYKWVCKRVIHFSVVTISVYFPSCLVTQHRHVGQVQSRGRTQT